MKKLPVTILFAMLALSEVHADESSSRLGVKQSINLIKQGQLDDAMANLNSVITEDPSNVQAYRARGNIFFAKEDFDSALSDFSKVVQLKPTSARAYFERAIAFFAAGKDKEGVEDIDQALTINPKLAATLSSTPKLRDKIDQLRQSSGKKTIVSPGKQKNGTVKLKNGTVTIKENPLQ